jgi:hypothetical protein
MAFGFTGLVSSGSTYDGKALSTLSSAGACNTTDLLDQEGKIINQTTIQGAVTVSADYYLKTGETWVNGATAGQTGSAVVTASAVNASNQGYQHVTETRRVLPDFTAS